MVDEILLNIAAIKELKYPTYEFMDTSWQGTHRPAMGATRPWGMYIDE